MKQLSGEFAEESPYATSTYAYKHPLDTPALYRSVWSRFYRLDRIITGPLGDSSRSQQIEFVRMLIK